MDNYLKKNTIFQRRKGSKRSASTVESSGNADAENPIPREAPKFEKNRTTSGNRAIVV